MNHETTRRRIYIISTPDDVAKLLMLCNAWTASCLLTNVPEQGSVRLAALDRGTLSAFDFAVGWRAAKGRHGPVSGTVRYGVPALYQLLIVPYLSVLYVFRGGQTGERFAVRGLRFAGRRGACILYIPGTRHSCLFTTRRISASRAIQYSATAHAQDGQGEQERQQEQLASLQPRETPRGADMPEAQKNGTGSSMVCTVQ